MIILLPFFLIIYTLVGWACIWLVRRLGYGNRVVWIVRFSLLGILFLDAIIGFLAFTYVCATEAEYIEYKKVKTNGFAYISLIDPMKYPNLAVTGAVNGANIFGAGERGYFTYLETEVINPDPSNLADVPGKYIYTLEKRGNPKCTKFEQLTEQHKNRLFNNWLPRDFNLSNYHIEGQMPLTKDNPQSFCVGVERIESFKSRYLMVDAKGPDWLKELFGVEFSGYRRVIDTRLNQVLSQHLFVKWDGGWLHRTFSSFDSPPDVHSCFVKRYTNPQIPSYWYKYALMPTDINFNNATDDDLNN